MSQMSTSKTAINEYDNTCDFSTELDQIVNAALSSHLDPTQREAAKDSFTRREDHINTGIDQDTVTLTRNVSRRASTQSQDE